MFRLVILKFHSSLCDLGAFGGSSTIVLTHETFHRKSTASERIQQHPSRLYQWETGSPQSTANPAH